MRESADDDIDAIFLDEPRGGDETPSSSMRRVSEAREVDAVWDNLRRTAIAHTLRPRGKIRRNSSHRRSPFESAPEEREDGQDKPAREHPLEGVALLECEEIRHTQLGEDYGEEHVTHHGPQSVKMVSAVEGAGRAGGAAAGGGGGGRRKKTCLSLL